VTLGPIQMGVAIGIPHVKDDGKFWPRVVEFEMVGDALSVSAADGMPMRGFPLEPTAVDVECVCQAIFDFIKSVMENPVRTATAVGTGRFGFIESF
jgi:hypothetical protein